MAQVACAYATSHILFSPRGVERQARNVVAGMQELGRRAITSRPDVALIIASDHMFNVNLSLQPPFVVGVADEYVGFGDMGVPARAFRGHRNFAEGLVRYAAGAGFDLAKAEELRPDHGITLPLLFLEPWGVVPAVPLFVNINMDPVPSSTRCLALAATIGDYIRHARPAEERVALIGSGGLSHWLRVANMGHVAQDFDEEIIALMTSGHASRIAGLGTAEIMRRGGNGGLEVLNWMMTAVAAGEPKGSRTYYEPIPPWQTGMGGVWLTV
jgi:aromatic ring-opening dioxygenase catalytic subunit (LigB family)